MQQCFGVMCFQVAIHFTNSGNLLGEYELNREVHMNKATVISRHEKYAKIESIHSNFCII